MTPENLFDQTFIQARQQIWDALAKFPDIRANIADRVAIVKAYERAASTISPYHIQPGTGPAVVPKTAETPEDSVKVKQKAGKK